MPIRLTCTHLGPRDAIYIPYNIVTIISRIRLQRRVSVQRAWFRLHLIYINIAYVEARKCDSSDYIPSNNILITKIQDVL